MTNIYVVGRDSSVERLFEERGHEVWAGDLPGENVLKSLDLAIFTGGSDIDPKWYGEENNGSFTSDYSRRRDEFEFNMYEKLTDLGIPKAGICRGGQLFNIANGGKMVQDIDGHEYGSHRVYQYDTRDAIGTTNSCHHQMMIPTEEAELVLFSLYDGGECPEIIYYPKNRDLCFQAHPEWGHENTTKLFMNYIKTCIGLEV
jgi:putative glutamine amidotransferase